MPKLSELGGQLDPVISILTEVSAQLEKATVEIVKAITENDPEVPQSVLDKVNALNNFAATLKTASQKLDDLNADTPQA